MSTYSVMSMLRNSKAASPMCSMFCSDPVSRLSMQITRCPLPSRCSQRCDPRKPAPPVTTQVVIGPDAIDADRPDARDRFLQFPGIAPGESYRRGERNGFEDVNRAYVRYGRLKRPG